MQQWGTEMRMLTRIITAALLCALAVSPAKSASPNADRTGIGSSASLPSTSLLIKGNGTGGAAEASVGIDYAQPQMSYVGLVSTGSRVANFVNTSINQSMSRSSHIATENLTSIQLVYGNWYVRGAGNGTVDGQELGLGCTLTLSVSIEYPAGTFTRVTWSSASSVAIADGANATSDVVNVPITFSSKYWVRTYQSSSCGNISTSNVSPPSGDGYQATGATDQTMSGSVTQASSQIYRPLAIIGRATRDSYLIIGDSIAMGQSDSADGAGDVGLFTRPLLRKPYAYANYAVGSDRATWFTTQSAKRRALAVYATRVLSNYGINDCLNGRTYANVTADLATIASLFPTQRFYQSLLTTTTVNSTDFFASTAGQTLDSAANQAVRNSVNNALAKSQIAGISGVIDTSGYETGYQNGVWPVETGGRTVTDGTMTAGSAALSSATAAFTTGDDYKTARVIGAGTSGGNLTCVMRFVSATQVTCTTNGTTSLTAGTTGSTFTVYVQAARTTRDGLHPSAEANRAFDQSGRMLLVLP